MQNDGHYGGAMTDAATAIGAGSEGGNGWGNGYVSGWAQSDVRDGGSVAGEGSIDLDGGRVGQPTSYGSCGDATGGGNNLAEGDGRGLGHGSGWGEGDGDG